jgi:hypothetical protein
MTSTGKVGNAFRLMKVAGAIGAVTATDADASTARPSRREELDAT